MRGVNVNLSLSEAAMRETDTLSYYCRFNPYYSEGSTLETAAGTLISRAFEPISREYLAAIGEVLGDLPGAARLFASKVDRSLPLSQPDFFLLEHRIEQAPNPSSRVVLSPREDGIGGRVADLDWQLNELDARTFQIGQDIIVRELSALGMGRFEVEEIDLDLMRDRAEGHYHHIGTTRMAASASAGVVDASLKVVVRGSGIPDARLLLVATKLVSTLRILTILEKLGRRVCSPCQHSLTSRRKAVEGICDDDGRHPLIMMDSMNSSRS